MRKKRRIFRDDLKFRIVIEAIKGQRQISEIATEFDVHPNQITNIKNQCSILDISRSGYYYKPAPISEYNLFLMKQTDEIFTESPEYGSRKISMV